MKKAIIYSAVLSLLSFHSALASEIAFETEGGRETIFEWEAGGKEDFELSIHTSAEELNGIWKYEDMGLVGTAAYYGQYYEATGVAATHVLDLTDYTNIELTFDNAFNGYFIDNKEISVEDFNGYAYVVVREDGQKEWTRLDDAITPPKAFNWRFYSNTPVDLSEYSHRKIQVGFQYCSTEQCAGYWALNNIKIMADFESGISNVKADNDFKPQYFDLQGRRVDNPTPGIYIKVVGSKSTKVIL